MQTNVLSKQNKRVYDELYQILKDGNIDPALVDRIANTLAKMKEGSLEILYLLGILDESIRDILRAKDAVKLKALNEEKKEGFLRKMEALTHSYEQGLARTKVNYMMLRLVPLRAIDSVSKRLVKAEALIDKQESRNRNIIIGVVVAVVLIVATVAVEVLLSNRSDMQFYSQLEKNIYDQNLKIQDLNNILGNLKIRNPYLK